MASKEGDRRAPGDRRQRRQVEDNRDWHRRDAWRPGAEDGLPGEDKRFSAKWANKAHNALGSFLHEPTLAQYDKDAGFDEEAARAKATEILAILEDILSTPLMSVNMGQFIQIDCDCGFKIKRKLAVLQAGKRFTCGGCGMHYLYTLNEAESRYEFVPDGLAYNCAKCGAGQQVPAHLVEQLPVLTCSECGAKAQVEQLYQLRPLELATS